MDTNNTTANAKAFLSRRIATPVWVLLTLGILTMCFGCSAIGSAVGNAGGTNTAAPVVNSSTGTQAKTSSSKPIATNTPRPTATATHVPTWQTVQTFNGNGIKNTDNFNPGSDTWKLVWSCDPSSEFGGQYNVIVAVENQDGSDADPAAVNTICKSGNTSGETIERNMSGSYYFSVNSEAAWTLKVEVLK